MNNKHSFIKKRLSQVIAASLAASLGATAFANDFTIQDGELRISSGAFDQTVTVGANGVITKPGANVPDQHQRWQCIVQRRPSGVPSAGSQLGL